MLRLQKLNRLQEYLLGPAGLEEKLKAVTENVVDIFNVDFCRIWIIRPGDLCDAGCMNVSKNTTIEQCRSRDTCLHLVASSGRYTHIDGGHRRVPLGSYKIGRLATEPSSKFLTNNVKEDHHIHNRDWARSLGLKSFAGYKLKDVKQKTVGVLALFSKNIITPEEDALLESLGNSIAQLIRASKAEESLIKASREIESWNRELEKKVKEKTDELRRSQEQLIQSEKLAAMGEMGVGLAHELNSPLGGILPMLEQYKNEAEKGSRKYKELSVMHKACEHMAKIIKDFSAFSRESKGEWNELDLNEVINDTLGFSASRIKQQGIQVYRENKDNLPKVLGEKTEIQQVVLNIIRNALDAMPDRGVLSIKTNFDKDKNNTLMEFIDNGKGIEKELLGKIFDPFYTTKRPDKGVGLGLSISYKIIKKHGGSLSVESEPGKGTKFTVYLPVAKSNNA